MYRKTSTKSAHECKQNFIKKNNNFTVKNLSVTLTPENNTCNKEH